MESPRHARLMNEAHGAINRVFRDNSVKQDQTLESLKELQDLISDLCNCLRDDMRKRYWDHEEVRAQRSLREQGLSIERAKQKAADYRKANEDDEIRDI